MGTVHREPPTDRGDKPSRKRTSQKAAPVPTVSPITTDERITFAMPATASLRPRYSDRERAMAMALLKANGFPEVDGALMHTARTLGIPHSSLQAWINGEHYTPPNVAHEKKDELSRLLDQVALTYTLRALDPEAVAKTSGKDAMTTAAIAIDKQRLLNGLPTVIVQQLPDVIGALQALGQDVTVLFARIIAQAEEKADYKRLGSG